MSYTHSIINNYTTQLGAAGNSAVSYTGDIEKNIDTTIPPSTTDEPLSIQWAFAKLQCFMFTASGACTIKTNSNTAPTTTLTLVANQLLMWGTQSVGASPIPGDVTGGLFVTNAGATAIAFKVRVLTSV